MLDDASLFHAMERDGGPEAFHFWESEQPLVVIGALGNVQQQVHEDACSADGVPIRRRISGGGAVVLARGCLNYSLILSLDKRPDLRHVESSYRIILGQIVEALNLPGLAIRGTSDIALHDRKVSGNSQRRGRQALLHHGTLLYDFDPAPLERYLKEPGRQPLYRARRPHAEFVTSLPVSVESLKATFVRAAKSFCDSITLVAAVRN